MQDELKPEDIENLKQRELETTEKFDTLTPGSQELIALDNSDVVMDEHDGRVDLSQSIAGPSTSSDPSDPSAAASSVLIEVLTFFMNVLILSLFVHRVNIIYIFFIISD